MLTLHHMTLSTPLGRILLKDLDLSVNPGDRLAIIGEEGNGKSTLCRLLADPALLDGAFIISGSRVAPDVRIGYLPQTLTPAQLEGSVAQLLHLEEPESGSIHRVQVLKQLAQLGILIPESRFAEPLSQFSGGERVKLTIAALMIERPELLVLDEPTNDLDLPTLRWLERFLLSTRIPVVFVSHDSALLSRCANRILHLEQTQRKTVPLWTLTSTGYDDYLQARSAHLMRQTSLANKQKADYDRQVERWRSIYQKVEHAQATISRQDPAGARLLKKKIKNLKAVKDRLDQTPKLKKPDPEEAVTLFFDPHPPVPSSKRLIDDHLERLEINGRLLAQGLELTVMGQDRIAIIGANGCGKTTYLNHLITTAINRGIKVGVMPQHYDLALPSEQCAVDALSVTGTADEKTRIMTILGNLKFTADEMLQPLSACSQGQKAKVVLTSLVMKDVELLILDEPTRNLSPLTLPVIESMLHDFHGAILAVSHDRRFVSAVFTRILELDATGLHPITSLESF